MPTDDPRSRPDEQHNDRHDDKHDDRHDDRAWLDRRRFLTLAGGASALGLLAACTSARRGASDASSTSVGGAPATSAAGASSSSVSTSPASSASAATSSTTAGAPSAVSSSAGRVLVVIQLGGGNDGLNTLVPLDGRYHDNRPTLALADADLLAVTGTSAYGLHPSLAPLKDLLAAGRVAALEAIGYTHPNRSHFAALDDWWSATPGQASTTGWLGRWLDATAGTDDDPLRAVALASGVPALAGARVRPTVVVSPKAFAFHPPRRASADVLDQLTILAPGDDPLAAAYRASVGRAASAVRTFATLPPAGGSSAVSAPGAEAATGDDPTAGEITRSLATAAQLVAGHAPTRIVHVAAGGFDTHAGQLETQKALLGDLALGIRSFFEQVTAAGQAERVLLMTVSEFGRRVHENGSGGTDHGKAGVQFVVGPSVAGGVYGQANLERLDDGDLAPDIDVRSLYTMALDWLGGPTAEVLGRRYDTFGVVRT